ncbi:hypothetical protein EVG20_g10998 [Dentipellis fragilis]|uniref:Uncharacterized protein n=1 Tax=Dentipellis fragilis TaxID=205917 RepID=A0A4Y9XNY4_9AGAM|nr:hypothetical protein EVG20_g10998 [Dentipellis fragilis]
MLRLRALAAASVSDTRSALISMDGPAFVACYQILQKDNRQGTAGGAEQLAYIDAGNHSPRDRACLETLGLFMPVVPRAAFNHVPSGGSLLQIRRRAGVQEMGRPPMSRLIGGSRVRGGCHADGPVNLLRIRVRAEGIERLKRPLDRIVPEAAWRTRVFEKEVACMRGCYVEPQSDCYLILQVLRVERRQSTQQQHLELREGLLGLVSPSLSLELARPLPDLLDMSVPVSAFKSAVCRLRSCRFARDSPPARAALWTRNCDGDITNTCFFPSRRPGDRTSTSRVECQRRQGVLDERAGPESKTTARWLADYVAVVLSPPARSRSFMLNVLRRGGCGHLASCDSRVVVVRVRIQAGDPLCMRPLRTMPVLRRAAPRSRPSEREAGLGPQIPGYADLGPIIQSVFRAKVVPDEPDRVPEIIKASSRAFRRNTYARAVSAQIQGLSPECSARWMQWKVEKVSDRCTIKPITCLPVAPVILHFHRHPSRTGGLELHVRITTRVRVGRWD